MFLRRAGRDEHDELIEVLTRQKVFPRLIQPFLKQLDYDPVTPLASRWRIAHGVVLNPSVAFGQPIVEASGIKTDVLAAAYVANNRDADRVAWWYNVTAKDVLAAFEFESQLAA